MHSTYNDLFTLHSIYYNIQSPHSDDIIQGVSLCVYPPLYLYNIGKSYYNTANNIHEI